MRALTGFAAALLLTCFCAISRAADLKVGDAAPALDIGKWVQGEPVKQLETGKIYVLEFWATWCGPCRATIPHLSDLSKEYKNITFIGVNCWEHDDALVEPFVKEMGEKMVYRVAMDNKSKEKTGAMAKTWMEAAGQDGIPCAFIIGKDAKIAWIGHPMQMTQVLKAVDAGTFDAKAEAAKQEKMQKLGETVQEKIVPQIRAKKYDEALAATEELIKANPEQRSELLGLKAHILMEKKDLPGVYAIVDELAAAKETEPAALNAMAWGILTDESFASQRDLDRALKLAQAAVDASKGKEAQYLDTLARAHAMKGNFDKAVETQQKAVDTASNDMKEELRKSLEAYKGKKVPPADEK